MHFYDGFEYAKIYIRIEKLALPLFSKLYFFTVLCSFSVAIHPQKLFLYLVIILKAKAIKDNRYIRVYSKCQNVYKKSIVL